MEGYVIGMDMHAFTARPRRVVVTRSSTRPWAVKDVKSAEVRAILGEASRGVFVEVAGEAADVDAVVLAYALTGILREEVGGPRLWHAELTLGGRTRLARGGLAAKQIAERLGVPFEGLVEGWTETVRPEPLDIEPDLVAAGERGENLLLVGPPGSGKTMRARRLGRTAPLDEATEGRLVEAYSVAGLGRAPWTRPFRAPHHTVSERGLLGEAHLATGGVLFLDEATEFRSLALEALAAKLRGWSEDATTRGSAPPQVIFTTNPCPCGWQGTTRRVCACTTEALARYEARTEKVRALFGARQFRVH